MEVQRPLQGLLLDVDGTTLDSRRAQYDWLKYAAQRFGGVKDFLSYGAEFGRRYNSFLAEKGMPGLYEMIGVDFHKHRKEIWEEYTRYNHENPPSIVEGLSEVIKEIFRRSRVTLSRPTALRMGMNTTKIWENVEPALTKAGLVQYFDTIVTKDDVYDYATNGVAKRKKIPFDDIKTLRTLLPEDVVKDLEKPGSLASMLALQRLNVEPDAVIAVEDTTDGVSSYKSILMPRRRVDLYVVGVTWGFEDKEALIAAGADEIIDKPEQLTEIVERLDGFL